MRKEEEKVGRVEDGLDDKHVRIVCYMNTLYGGDLHRKDKLVCSEQGS